VRHQADGERKECGCVEGCVKRACNRCNHQRGHRVTLCPRCGSPEFRIVKEHKK